MDGYYLSADDRDFLIRLRSLFGERMAPKDGEGGGANDDRPLVGRVKPGTTITSMKVVKDADVTSTNDKFQPGKGVVVLWSPRLILEDDPSPGAATGAKRVKPILRKLRKNSQDPTILNQNITSQATDIEVTVYNYTPFEVFDIHYVAAQPTRNGMLSIQAPPWTTFIAKKPAGTIAKNKAADCEIGYLRQSNRLVTDTAEIVWLMTTANVPMKRLCWHLGDDPITDPVGTLMLVRPEAGGAFVIDTVYCT